MPSAERKRDRKGKEEENAVSESGYWNGFCGLNNASDFVVSLRLWCGGGQGQVGKIICPSDSSFHVDRTSGQATVTPVVILKYHQLAFDLVSLAPPTIGTYLWLPPETPNAIASST